MFANKRHVYTLEEYFALEEKAEYKSEYHQGQIVAMAGASLEHNRIFPLFYPYVLTNR